MKEKSKHIDKAGKRVFGFCQPSMRTPPWRLILNPDRDGNGSFEVHKDGKNVDLLGYVSEEQFEQLLKSDRPPLKIPLYCDHGDNHIKLVSIPTERVIKWENRSEGDETPSVDVVDVTVC
jgi:hypothetical protein